MVAGQNPGAQFTTVTLGCEENGRGRGSIRELRRTNTQNELSCLMRRRGIGFPLANTFESCGARGGLPCTHLAIAQTYKRWTLWLRQLHLFILLLLLVCINYLRINICFILFSCHPFCLLILL